MPEQIIHDERITPEEIVKRVEDHDKATRALRGRYIKRYELYTLQPYQVSKKTAIVSRV